MRDSGLHSRLEDFWRAPAFRVGDREYHHLDVALSAMARGAWPEFERRLAEGLACVAHAAINHIEPSAADIDAAATAFRYDRDLIAAEDMNQWLDAVDLSFDEWTAYLTRALLRERFRDVLEDVLDRHLPTSGQLVETALAEGVCSGAFEVFEQAFAARAAIAVQADMECGEAGETSASDRPVSDLAHTYAHWLSAHPVEHLCTRLRHVLQIERRFHDFVTHLAQHAPLAEVVERHRLEWQQIELDALCFGTEDAAREAMLCVTIDRMSLHDVAAVARRAAERRTLFHDEIDPDLCDRLLTIEPGGVVGPIAVNGHFEVATLVRRTRPSLAEPGVVERARQTVIDAAIERATRDGVRRARRS